MFARRAPPVQWALGSRRKASATSVAPLSARTRPPSQLGSRLVRQEARANLDVAQLKKRVDSIVSCVTCEPRLVARVVGDAGFAKQLADLERLDTWFDNAVDRGKMPAHPYIYSALVNAYSKSGDFGRAETLIKKQEKLNVSSPHSYTALLNAYLSRGFIARAEMLLKEMKKHNVPPTVVTYHVLLCTYAERGGMEKVDELLKEMAASNMKPDELTLGHMLTAFSKAGNTQAVNRLAALLPPSTVGPNSASGAALWQSRIHSALKAGDTQAAYKLTTEAHNLGVSLAPNTYGHLINSLARTSQMEEMETAVKLCWATGRLPPIETFNAVIAAYCHHNQADKAIAFMRLVKDRGAGLNSDSYNPILYEYATRGVMDKFEPLLQELYASGLSFSDATYRLLLKVFLITHDHKRAKVVLRDIRTHNVPIKPNFFNSALKQLVDSEPRYSD